MNVVLCGEDVYLLDKSKTGDIKLPLGDLMIFDNSRAILNSYGQIGRLISHAFYDEGDDISGFLELKKKPIEQAKKI